MHEWSAIAFEFIFIMIRSLCHISHSNFSFSNIGFTSLHLGHSHSFNVIEGKVIFLTKKKNGFCWTRAASRTPFFLCFYCEGGILKEKQRMLSKRKSKVWKETTKAQRKKWDIMFCRERLNRNRNWYATKQINGMRFFFLHSTYEGKNVTTYIKVSSVQHFVLIVTKERKKTNDNRWKITVKWENCVKSENIIYSPFLSRFVGLFLNMALDGPGVDCEPYILIT